MKREFMVLEAPDRRTGEPFNSRSSFSRSRILGSRFAEDNFDPIKPVLTVEELTPSEVFRRSKDSAVRGIAPKMPTRLIAPLSASATESETEDTASSAWGVSAVGADKSAFSGKGVIVSVLDTGIDRNHEAFSGITLTEQDFSGDGNGDRQGHGTHCAGTIFGRAVAGKRIGIAPGVEKALIGKVLRNDGTGDSLMLFKGIEWAVEGGANVISMSLGFDFPGWVEDMVQRDRLPVDLATSIALQDYRANLRFFDSLLEMIKNRAVLSPDKDPVFVAAAGNESKRDISSDYTVGVSIPAAIEGIVSVGALQQTVNGLDIAWFSNIYPQISAPGVNILSAQIGGGLKRLSGTSMACPHVAGIAALWWETIRSSGMVRANSDVVVDELLTNASRDESEITNFTPDDYGRGLAKAPK